MDLGPCLGPARMLPQCGPHQGAQSRPWPGAAGPVTLKPLLDDLGHGDARSTAPLWTECPGQGQAQPEREGRPEVTSLDDNPSRHPCPLPPGVVSWAPGKRSSGSGRWNQMHANQAVSGARIVVTPALHPAVGRGSSGSASPGRRPLVAYRRFSASLAHPLHPRAGPQGVVEHKSQSTFTHECWGRWPSTRAHIFRTCREGRSMEVA